MAPRVAGGKNAIAPSLHHRFVNKIVTEWSKIRIFKSNDLELRCFWDLSEVEVLESLQRLWLLHHRGHGVGVYEWFVDSSAVGMICMILLSTLTKVDHHCVFTESWCGNLAIAWLMPDITWRHRFVRISKHQYINPHQSSSNCTMIYSRQSTRMLQTGSFVVIIWNISELAGQDTRVQWSISSQVQLWISLSQWGSSVESCAGAEHLVWHGRPWRGDGCSE